MRRSIREHVDGDEREPAGRSGRLEGVRSRGAWAALGAAVAVTLGAGTMATVDAVTGTGERAVYTAITPCRLQDTRPDTRIGPDDAIGPAERRTIDARGARGECLATQLPDDAVALSLNVTAVGATAPTFVQLWPEGDRPASGSSLNPTPGAAPSPNAVTTELSATGTFEVFNRFGHVDLVIDVVGFHTDHHHDDRYYTKDQADLLAVPSFTHFAPKASASLTGVNDIPVKMNDLADFSTDGGTVKLTWMSAGRRSGVAGTCILQLRVDGQPARPAGANGTIGSEVRISTADANQPFTVVEVFTDLRAGTHTAEVWLRNSSGGTCTHNPGTNVRSLLVENYPDPAPPIVFVPAG